MMTIRAILVPLALTLSISGAAAQAPPSPTTPPPPTALAEADCVATPPITPRSNIAPDTTVGQASEPLGDRLAKSNGVLCPPSGVDPEMRAPTPDAGNTPVIPPPGTPGGNPNVQPK